jgi:hypothetical protein
MYFFRNRGYRQPEQQGYGVWHSGQAKLAAGDLNETTNETEGSTVGHMPAGTRRPGLGRQAVSRSGRYALC